MNKDVAEMSQAYQVEAAEQGVPVGYKQTEVGVIPEDWQVKALGDLVEIYSGESPSKFKFLTSGVSYFKVEQLNNGAVYADSTPYFIETSKVVVAGSVIFPKRGASILSNKIRVLKQASFMDTNLMALTCLAELNELYLYNQLTYRGLDSVADTTSIPQINNKHIIPFLIPFPTKVEQTTIANALSDVDALLSELEKLIAKKQAIKTATMQQLLTGRTRLPQFALHQDGLPTNSSGANLDAGTGGPKGEGQEAIRKGYKQSELGEIPEDWELCMLSNFIFALESGVSVNSTDQNDAFSHGKHVLKTSCVGGGYFYDSEKKSILPEDLKRAKCSPQAGSIIVSRMNTPDLVGELGYVERDLPDSFLPDRLWQMNIKKNVEINTRWLAYFLSFPDTSKKIKEAATGTSGSMKNISKGSLLSLIILVPSQIEQTAIATILSDMDEEIQALEQRLNKTRQIKQGMMQQLLTGKVRLV